MWSVKLRRAKENGRLTKTLTYIVWMVVRVIPDAKMIINWS